MEKRRIGNSDIDASVIGFGAWAAGKTGWGNVDENEVKDAILRAVDLEVNFFDTAPVYGYGESERIIGEALQNVREQVYIATKCGLLWDEKGKVQKHNGKESILKEVDASLKRLNTDYIDLYQVHWPDVNTPISETMDALNEILHMKKVKYVGVSNFSAEQMEEAKIYAPIISLQSQYSILKRKVENEDIPFVEREGMSLIPYSPLAQGLLTGKFSKDFIIDEKDVRAFNPLFKEEAFAKNLEIVEKMKPIAEKYDRPLSQVAVNWLLSKKVVSSVICGARNAAQVEENTNASEWKLAKEDVAFIDSLLESRSEGAR
ncbi:aldo/keto reductase [Lottiidibacillus patelloidae]|uniref:Aldo/keto reductase n=1 Tax=Lottiidibacillus patelloidae TaxID=2670334 RepID=A0A263BXG2_9BACI|nr:aldo/keto reductase [Lottiidibacillus patelloidae]OZM58419.1 aldo/keto reductase [Lottiidibacillus patelloidae]